MGLPTSATWPLGLKLRRASLPERRPQVVSTSRGPSSVLSARLRSASPGTGDLYAHQLILLSHLAACEWARFRLGLERGRDVCARPARQDRHQAPLTPSGYDGMAPPSKGWGPSSYAGGGATGYWMGGRSPESRCEPTSPCTYLTLHLLTFPQSRGGSACRTDIRLGFQEHARCDAGSNGLVRCPSEVSQADRSTDRARTPIAAKWVRSRSSRQLEVTRNKAASTKPAMIVPVATTICQRRPASTGAVANPAIPARSGSGWRPGCG